MTSNEFRDALATLKPMTQVVLGRDHIGKSVRTIRRYASGEEDVPVLVAEKMTALVEAKKAADAKGAKRAARA